MGLNKQNSHGVKRSKLFILKENICKINVFLQYRNVHDYYNFYHSGCLRGADPTFIAKSFLSGTRDQRKK